MKGFKQIRSAIIHDDGIMSFNFLYSQLFFCLHLIQIIGQIGLIETNQMGLIIEELRDRKPDLPYFDEAFAGEYPEEAPFTISELEDIYPKASKKSKENEEFKNRSQIGGCIQGCSV